MAGKSPEPRREIYLAQKERQQSDPKFIAMKERQKAMRKEAYQKQKQQRADYMKAQKQAAREEKAQARKDRDNALAALLIKGSDVTKSEENL